MDKREQEFKALLRIASLSWNTTIQIFDTIEKALHEHPEWKIHLEVGEIRCLE